MDLARLEEWLAELTVWAAAPDAEQTQSLVAQAHGFAHSSAAKGRPALRLLFLAFTRALGRARDPQALTEAALVAVELAHNRDPADFGLEAALTALYLEAGLTNAQGHALDLHLRDELARELRESSLVLRHVEPQASLAATDVANDDSPGDEEPSLSAADVSSGPRYVAPEERDLIVGALQGELFIALAEFSAQSAPRALGDELNFLLSSIGRALDAVGLPQLSCALAQHAAALVDPLTPGAADCLSVWLVNLLGWFDQPSDEAATEVALSSAPGTLADALETELRSVQFVVDPSFKLRPARSFEEADLSLKPAADVIPSVLQGMLRELPGHADVLSRSLEVFARSGDRIALDDARRSAHTLKGDANTVGIRGLANLTHALEDILVELDKRGGEPKPGLLQLLNEGADCVAAMADAVLGRGNPPENAPSILRRVYALADAFDRGEAAQEGESISEPHAGEPQANVTLKPSPVAATPEAEPDELLSVSRQLLDRLLESSGEAVALANQLLMELESVAKLREELNLELQTLGRVTASLDEQVALRGHSLELVKRSKQSTLDPLELEQYNELNIVSRQMNESHADARARLVELDQGFQRLESLSRQKSRLADDLQSNVQRARLMRIGEVSGRFERAVRQAARTLEKPADIQIIGDALSIDKVMLDALIEPVMHLLRNAVDHGLEAPDRRSLTAKPAQGLITLKFSQVAQMLKIEVSDDGGGMDYPRIAQRARALGVLDEDSDVDASFLHSLLFLPGFSTRDEVSQLSGRGVGMDVVARRVQSLGGNIEISSEPGAGSHFELNLPLALGTRQVALLQFGEQALAITCDSFSRFAPLAPDDQRIGVTGLEARVDGEWLSAIDGGRLFDLSPVVTASEMVNRVGLLIEIPGENTRVVLASKIAGLVTVVLKSLDDFLQPIRGIRGAAVLGDGRATAVIDLREFARTRRSELLNALPDFEVALELAARVVVADDSLTVRRSLGELLEDAGYAPELARDGLEALTQIEKLAPRALLVDLEMPRMNGLELTAHLRRDPRFEHLPIIMITSRTSDLHVQLARNAGVTDILSKPYSDDELLTVLAAAIDSASEMLEVEAARR